MGRTVLSYRLALEEEIATWKNFSRTLRTEDREAFEQMMNACRCYASDASMVTRPVVLEAMFMSIMLVQQRALTDLRREVADWKKS